MSQYDYCVDYAVSFNEEPKGRPPAWVVFTPSGEKVFLDEEAAQGEVLSFSSPVEVRQAVLVGCNVMLLRLDDGAKRQFFTTNTNKQNLVSHMNSLTDDLCSSFFDKDKRKEKKVKNAS